MLFRVLSEDRRPLARPRPLRDPRRTVAEVRPVDALRLGGDDPLMRAYHDEEWGVPERDSRALWEKLMLDGFQAGLAWITVLRKRDAFRGRSRASTRARRRPTASGRRAAARQRRDHPLAGEDRGDDRQRPGLPGDGGGRRGLREFCWSFTDGEVLRGDGSEFPARTPLSESGLQGAEAARLQVRRPDDRLRLDAGGRHRQRPRLDCFRRDQV